MTFTAAHRARLLHAEHAAWREVKERAGSGDLAPLLAIFDEDGRKVAFAQATCDREATYSGLGAAASLHLPLILNLDAAIRDLDPTDRNDVAEMAEIEIGDLTLRLHAGDVRVYEALTSQFWYRGDSSVITSRYRLPEDAGEWSWGEPETADPLDGLMMSAAAWGDEVGRAHGPVTLETGLMALSLLGWTAFLLPAGAMMPEKVDPAD